MAKQSRPPRKRTSDQAELPNPNTSSKRSKSSSKDDARDKDTNPNTKTTTKKTTATAARRKGGRSSNTKKTAQAEQDGAEQGDAEEAGPASGKGKGKKPIKKPIAKENAPVDPPPADGEIADAEPEPKGKTASGKLPGIKIRLKFGPTEGKKITPPKKPKAPKKVVESEDTPFNAGTTAPTESKKHNTRHSDRIANLNQLQQESSGNAPQDGSPGPSGSIRTTEDIYDFYSKGKHPKRYFDKMSAEEIDINEYIKIKPVEGRGRGVFAKRLIPAGTLLLQERTLLDQVPISNENVNKALREKVSALSKNDKHKFLLLCHEADKDTEESRVKSNAFELDSHGKEVYVWFNISMLNHSCLPNAHISYLDFNGQAGYNLRARVDIDMDEEVLLNYKPDWESFDNNSHKQASIPVAERKERIQEQWGFQCLCPLCKTDEAVEQTDKDYKELHRLRTEVMKFKKAHVPDRDARDYYNAHMSNYVKLLKKYHHIPTVNKNTKAAAEFMAGAPPEDDLAKIWTAKWQAEALAAGMADHGIESIAKTNGLGNGFQKSKSRSELPSIVKKIPGTVDKPFSTPVAPWELEFGDVEDDADDLDGPTLVEGGDAEQDEEHNNENDEEQGRKEAQSSKPNGGKGGKRPEKNPRLGGQEASSDDDESPDEENPADEPSEKSGKNGKSLALKKTLKPRPKKSLKLAPKKGKKARKRRR